MIGPLRLGPSMVLICHEDDPIDREGIASWLAHSFSLVGIVLLRNRRRSLAGKLRREYRRVGFLRLLDVVLFRLFYRLRYAREDARWMSEETQRLQNRYPASLEDVPTLVADHPNDEEVRAFIARLNPDFALARCKYILTPDVFDLPRFGTYVLHPGVCPLYRNAHGCFWALVNRDPDHVGMTLLKADDGIDTGPVYLYASYPFDESRESHIVIQHRVVLENLDQIARALYAIADGYANPIKSVEQSSRNWGQPWLTAWMRWKRQIQDSHKVMNNA
jgi:hypothetical protein